MVEKKMTAIARTRSDEYEAKVWQPNRRNPRSHLDFGPHRAGPRAKHSYMGSVSHGRETDPLVGNHLEMDHTVVDQGPNHFCASNVSRGKETETPVATWVLDHTEMDHATCCHPIGGPEVKRLRRGLE